MMLMGIPGKRKASPRLRNVIAAESWLGMPMMFSAAV